MTLSEADLRDVIRLRECPRDDVAQKGWKAFWDYAYQKYSLNRGRFYTISEAGKLTEDLKRIPMKAVNKISKSDQ